MTTYAEQARDETDAKARELLRNAPGVNSSSGISTTLFLPILADALLAARYDGLMEAVKRADRYAADIQPSNDQYGSARCGAYQHMCLSLLTTAESIKP